MPINNTNNSQSIEQRMQVFAALVEAQDGNMSVPESRKVTAERFGLTEQQVLSIEREGIDGEWPPLS